jgi:hypothetical protein
VDLAKEVVGAEVEEEDSVVEAVVVEAVVGEAAGEEVAANQQQQQQHQRTCLEMDLKEYHPPYFEEILSYSTPSNKNGGYTELPTSITTI